MHTHHKNMQKFVSIKQDSKKQPHCPERNKYKEFGYKPVPHSLYYQVVYLLSQLKTPALSLLHNFPQEQ